MQVLHRGAYSENDRRRDTIVKRASYRDAIDCIAQNDSPADDDSLDPEAVKNLVSSRLVAEIFAVEPIKVGNDVVKRRKALGYGS